MDAVEAILARHGMLAYEARPAEPEKVEILLQAAAAPSPATLQP
jgi:hypothetical protein